MAPASPGPLSDEQFEGDTPLVLHQRLFCLRPRSAREIRATWLAAQLLHFYLGPFEALVLRPILVQVLRDITTPPLPATLTGQA